MLDRVALGRLPPKPHLVFRSESGAPYYEECLTRQGFDGPYSILYHEHRPHEASPVTARARFPLPTSSDDAGLLRRHYPCLGLPSSAESPLQCRIPLLFNSDLVIGFLRPSRSDAAYFANADADDLYFVLRGSGIVRSVFGDLEFQSGDYVCVPKGTLHRFILKVDVEQAWLSIECKSGLSLPARYRNALGQLRMDAPYSHRDFRKPVFQGPLDEPIRDQVVKRGDRFFGFRWQHSPLDVIGWDGVVYPFAFPILAFQPRVGQVHLPPPVHTTFEAGGAVICSFVPRLLDFHDAANPCPYPHSSVDVDEVLFYANGNFGSRRGIREGSLSHHPAGITHGPHPGAYENPTPASRTEELAVMLDAERPLTRTEHAAQIEDPAYHASFVAS